MMQDTRTTLPIWIHAANAAHQRAAALMACRFFSTTGLTPHLSSAAPWALTLDETNGSVFEPVLSDAKTLWMATETQDKHSIIWVGPPNFQGMARLPKHANRQIVFANITEQDIPERVLKIFPTHAAKMLLMADLFFANTAKCGAKLAKLGVRPEHIKVTGPLQRASAVPNILGDPDEFDMIKGRPIWAAIGIDPKELPMVLTAQRMILRENHRMLLIISPHSYHQETDILKACNDLGLRVSLRSADEYPDTSTAVYISDGPDEITRWQSLSPITFLGQSLTPNLQGSDPFVAAALGSAILYGPYISEFLGDYTDLANAGAARIVRDGDSLATAVLQMANPQLAAQMGLAAWDYISKGADATDAVVTAALAHIEGEQSASPQVLE